MSVVTTNSGIEVPRVPTFRSSLSHQYKKLMCYKGHLNRKKLHKLPVDTEIPIASTNNASGLRVFRTITIRDPIAAYGEPVISMFGRPGQQAQHGTPSLVKPVAKGEPDEEFGNIVLEMMKMPELPPVPSSDVQQAVHRCWDSKDRKLGCDSQLLGPRQKTSHGNEGCQRSCSHNQRVPSGEFRRSYPTPSGAEKLVFLDFPSPSASSVPQHQFNHNEKTDPTPSYSLHNPGLLTPPSPSTPFAGNHSGNSRNTSAFQFCSKNEQLHGDPCLRNHPQPAHQNSLRHQYPLPSGTDKLACLDRSPDLRGVTNSNNSHAMGCNNGLQDRNLSYPMEHHENSSIAVLSKSPFTENSYQHDNKPETEMVPNRHFSHASYHNKDDYHHHHHNSTSNQTITPITSRCCMKQNHHQPHHSQPTSSYQHEHHHHASSCNLSNSSNSTGITCDSGYSSKEEYIPQGNQYKLSELPERSSTKVERPSSSTFSQESTESSQSMEVASQSKLESIGNANPPRRGPGRPRKPENERKRKPAKSIPLWKFLLNMLHDPATCPSLVKWEDLSKGMFRIVRSDVLAARWGMRKDNSKMNYEKFSRAMRYYYKQHIFEAVPGKRLVYQFGSAAKEWRPKNLDDPNFERR